MRVVVAAAIRRGNRLLIAQRAHPPTLAGLWELPGGKVEAGETERDALVRECREELGVEVIVGSRVGEDVRINDDSILRVYVAELRDDEPRALEHLQLHWISQTELPAVDWLPVNARLIPHLSDLLLGVA